MRPGIKRKRHKPSRKDIRAAREEAALNWLVESILSIFPATSWKDFPLFPGTAENKGIIWGNGIMEMPVSLSVKPLPQPVSETYQYAKL